MAKSKDLSAKIWKLQSLVGRHVEISQPAKPWLYVDAPQGQFPWQDGSPLDVEVGTLTEILISPEDIILTVQTQDGEKLWMIQDDTRIVLLS